MGQDSQNSCLDHGIHIPRFSHRMGFCQLKTIYKNKSTWVEDVYLNPLFDTEVWFWQDHTRNWKSRYIFDDCNTVLASCGLDYVCLVHQGSRQSQTRPAVFCDVFCPIQTQAVMAQSLITDCVWCTLSRYLQGGHARTNTLQKLPHTKFFAFYFLV